MDGQHVEGVIDDDGGRRDVFSRWNGCVIRREVSGVEEGRCAELEEGSV